MSFEWKDIASEHLILSLANIILKGGVVKSVVNYASGRSYIAFKHLYVYGKAVKNGRKEIAPRAMCVTTADNHPHISLQQILVADPLPLKKCENFWDQDGKFSGARGPQYFKIYEGSGMDDLAYTNYITHFLIGIEVSYSKWKGKTPRETGALLTFELPEHRYAIVVSTSELNPFAANRGKIYLFASNKRVNHRADSLFLKYQAEAMKTGFLRRYALRSVSLI